MKVGVVSTNSSPYVIRDGDKYSGISIEIWEKVAKKSDISFEYIEAGEDLDNAIERLKNKEFDILVGPYTITSKRYQDINYTIPYYQADIALATSKNTNNLEKYIKISKMFIYIIVFFLFVLIVNNLIVNFDIKKSFVDSILDSIPNFKNRKMYILYTIIFLCLIIVYINTFNPDISLTNNKKDYLVDKNLAYYTDNDMFNNIIKKYKAKSTLIKVKKTSDHKKQVQDNFIFNYYIKNQDNVYGFLDDSSKIAYILNHNIKKYRDIKIIENDLAFVLYAFILPKKSDHLDIINEKLREAQKEKINQIIITKYLGPKFGNHVTF